jgi:hypothetical protein
MLRTIAATVAVAAALSACSTLPKDAPAPVAAPPAFSASINIQTVSGSAASGVKTPSGSVQSLTQALRSQFVQPNQGPAANLVFTISDYRPATGRAKTTRMTVKVSITTPSGSALRQFAVTREVEGATAEARASLIAQAAEAIAKTARGEAAPS